MVHVVIAYDRSQGRRLLTREFALGQEDAARAFRLEQELAHCERTSVEVVLLTGENVEMLQRNHGRYFHTIDEILTAAVDHREAG